ncbi:VanZ like family protein [Carboxydocella thermautotrophica]|nr:VanZ like family protein [Carboxydocella thermautotrophica]
MFGRGKLVWLVLGFGWLLLIFWFSSQPFALQRALYSSSLRHFLALLPAQLTFVEAEYLLRKFAHVVEYTIFGFILLRVLGRWWPALLFLPLIALFDELNQRQISGRHGRWQDVLLDLSIFYLLAIFNYCRAKFRQEKTKSNRR